MANQLKERLKNEWRNDERLRINHLEVENFQTTGRGLKTKATLSEGDEIISLPIETILTGKKLCDQIEELNKQRLELKLSNEWVLVFYLAFYCKDHYPEYFNSLPKEFPNYFLYWTESDFRQVCQGSLSNFSPVTPKRSKFKAKSDEEKGHRRKNYSKARE